MHFVKKVGNTTVPNDKGALEPSCSTKLAGSINSRLSKKRLNARNLFKSAQA